MTTSKVLVVYYSRTGATRRLAEALANALQADIEPITDRENRSGIFGYLRSVAESLQKRGASITPMNTHPASYDLVVVGTPVWAWSVSSPVRSYLAAYRGHLPDIAFFLRWAAEAASARSKKCRPSPARRLELIML